MHKAESVLKNLAIQTHHFISTRGSDLVIINKNKNENMRYNRFCRENQSKWKERQVFERSQRT